MGRLVGLVPAAGRAARLLPLPCSKELFPIGFVEVEREGSVERRPKPVSMYLLERMAAAGVERIAMVVSPGKEDLMRFYGSDFLGVPLAYVFQRNMRGMPFALDAARPWVVDDTVLFGMPDTIFSPFDAFRKLLHTHRSTAAHLTLGLFPTAQTDRFGMVAFDRSLRLKYTIDKPVTSELKHMWGIGCWGPVFTEFMSRYLVEEASQQQEIVLGDIFQRAHASGLEVTVVPFEDGEYIDIGAPTDLQMAIKRFGV